MRRLSRYGWRAAEPARRPVLFVNPRSGGGRAAQAGLVERARERGIDALVLGPHQDLAALVGEAVADGADALGMAGGDGSLAVVAAAARAHGLPFVCVPAGTRNHFALDLGVDRHDLVGALDAFGDYGVERSIDVAEVNRRVFLNNVSLGIYGEAVQQTAYRDAKVRTLLETTAEVLGPSRAAEVRLVDDLGREHRHPAVVLVSNNPYALDRPVAPGTRPRLDGGELGIVVLDRPRPKADPPARFWSATHLAVDATAPVHAGVDGEAVELDAPLSFVIRPGALRVRISSRHPGVSPSGRLP
jgi:diacylglycerol kinase family enzyme